MEAGKHPVGHEGPISQVIEHSVASSPCQWKASGPLAKDKRRRAGDHQQNRSKRPGPAGASRAGRGRARPRRSRGHTGIPWSAQGRLPRAQAGEGGTALRRLRSMQSVTWAAGEPRSPRPPSPTPLWPWMARPGCACTQGGCGRTIERGRGNPAAAGWEHLFARALRRRQGGSGRDRLSGLAQAAGGGGRWSSPGDRSTRLPRRYRVGISPSLPPPSVRLSSVGEARPPAASPASLHWLPQTPCLLLPLFAFPRAGAVPGTCGSWLLSGLGPARVRPPAPWGRSFGAWGAGLLCALCPGAACGAAGSACVGHLLRTMAFPCPLFLRGFTYFRGREGDEKKRRRLSKRLWGRGWWGVGVCVSLWLCLCVCDCVRILAASEGRPEALLDVSWLDLRCLWALRL